MNNFYSSVVNYLQSAAEETLGSVGASVVQILSPPIAWNWNTAVSGQMSMAQFAFCDLMPQDIQAENYAQSSRSFSDGYSSFLELINLQTFPLPTLVKQSIVNNILPQSASKAAKGWAQTTNQAGQLEWKRVWNLSQSPQAWLSGIDQSQKSEPVELIFNDPALCIYAEDGTVLPTTQSPLMQITAKAVGRIQVTADSWYNSSIVTIAESSKNYFRVDPSVVFGDDGLINCRITEFIVALKPEPLVTVDNSLIDSQAIAQDSITCISLAGFAFTNKDAFAADDATVIGKVDFSLSPVDATHTQIKGNLTGADSDNIFIIAVILENNTMPG
jgi:hypothetical protein